MTRLLSVAFPSLFLSLLCFSCSRKNSSDVVATVGGSFISSNELKKIVNEENKDSLFVFDYISGWAEKELLFLGALSVGLDKDLDIKQRVYDYKKTALGMGFLKLKKKNITVGEKEINTYYNKNLDAFTRKRAAILSSVVSVTERSLALKIKKKLKSTSSIKASDIISKYRGVTKEIQSGELPIKINNKLFNGSGVKAGSVVGPYFVDSKYHLFKIEKLFKRGSFFDIENVYSEIYQRIKNKKENFLYEEIIDSLSLKYNVKIQNKKIRSLF